MVEDQFLLDIGNHELSVQVAVHGHRQVNGWKNQAYSRLSITHGHITNCKLLVCMHWTRLALVRPAASLYSASPLKRHPMGKQ